MSVQYTTLPSVLPSSNFGDLQYRIVDSTVIFNTFFSLLLFGWLGDVPTDLDPPQHLLRIRLICVLLNTCGHYFGHGSARRRLDYFLALFRRYFWLKKESFVWHDQCPFPTAIHHLVEDTLARLRRDFPLLKSLQEAEAALKKYEKMQVVVRCPGNTWRSIQFIMFAG